MTNFAIYGRDITANTDIGAADLRVVGDRFSLGAFIAAPFWCIWHGLWLELAALFGVAVVLAFATVVVGEDAAGWLGLAVAVLLGLEASAIRNRALERKGYALIADVAAPNRLAAETWWVGTQLAARRAATRQTLPKTLPDTGAAA
jgi:uncharacterized protein DUF2628